MTAPVCCSSCRTVIELGLGKDFTLNLQRSICLELTIMSKYAYPIDQTAMMSSLKPMQRPQKDTGDKFPKHTVQNSSIGKAGITESSEEKSGTKDGLAELAVLKAILNREGYLNRLKAVARTVGKKFKPEVADVLDFVRATTLDVIDMIVRWREVKV